MISEQRLGRRGVLEGIIEQAKKIPKAHYDTLAAFMLAESIMPEGYRFFYFGQYNADVQGFSLGVLMASSIENPPFLIGNIDNPNEFLSSAINIYRFFRNFGIIMLGVGMSINNDFGYFGCLMTLVSEGVRASLDYKMEDIVDGN